MRKQSAKATVIHSLIHTMMRGWENGNDRAVAIAFHEALGIDLQDRRQGGSGYSLGWFVEIAQQYPVVLDTKPSIREFVTETWPTQCKAIRQGRRDYRTGWGLSDNPYDSYTAELANECWIIGWKEACAADDNYEDDDIGLYDE